MIQQAIACDDPVIFFEPKRRYWEKAEVDPAADAAAAVQLPGAAHRAPTLTLAGYGPMVRDLPGGGRRGRGRRARRWR